MQQEIKRGFLEIEESKVHFLKFGTGSKLLIAIHGFGDRASMFTVLKPALENHYTVYTIDLPYHGFSEWKKKQYDKKDVAKIVAAILQLEQKEKFSLMGYSFGGRIVQAILPQFIEKLERIYLIAPDGIDTRWMFNLSLMPLWMRFLLRRLLQNPKWFIKMMAWLHRMGFVSKFIHDFTYNHVYTRERRDRIFCTWVSLDHFKTHPEKVRKLLKKYPIPVELYFGTRDEVIPVSAGEQMAEGMPNIHLHILEEGHLLVDSKLNTLLEKQLKTVN